MTTKRTHCQMILSALKGGPMTQSGFLRLCGSWKLAQRIYDLRKRGVEIETTYITRPNGARVAQYKLKGWKPTYVESA